MESTAVMFGAEDHDKTHHVYVNADYNEVGKASYHLTANENSVSYISYSEADR